jgi:hypothetical protein
MAPAKTGSVAASQHLGYMLHKTPLIRKKKFLYPIGILYCSRINRLPLLLCWRIACVVRVRRFQRQERRAACTIYAVPGERPETEAADLGRLELFWNDRLTYPTGRFDPRWLRAAAAQHARLPVGLPAGVPAVLNALSPLRFSTTNFTALGPQPERMTGCSGCFDYTTTEGRVNSMAVDPTTTVNGSIVAYLGRSEAAFGRRPTVAVVPLLGPW